MAVIDLLLTALHAAALLCGTLFLAVVSLLLMFALAILAMALASPGKVAERFSGPSNPESEGDAFRQ
jgi:hypothetical protein